MSFAYRILTFSDLPSHAVRLLILRFMSVLTLKYVSIFKFGLLRFRSPLLTESRLISFPPPTQMFHFGGFPSLYYLIHIMILDSSSRWFPNSEICGSILIYSSPQLIAVSHVLLRLPMPRHSPYALFRLNFPIFINLSIYALLSQIIFRLLFIFPLLFSPFVQKMQFFYQLSRKTSYFLVRK